MNSYGLVFGGEKTSHDSGNDITYQVVSGNNYSQVVIEGDEYILPKEAMQSEKVYDFEDKLPIEMLDEIKRSVNVFIEFPNLRQGDMVICKNSVRNDELHTIKGTAKEIANFLQGLSACRIYAKGGQINEELADGGEVENDSQIRFLTPMPPKKLGKTGIDSLSEIVGKDETYEVFSGALYAGRGRIVASDKHILVVLENQNYPNSLDGKLKSLWDKVPQSRLEDAYYPNWQILIPNQQNFETKELPIDDVIAYAYGGFLEAKKIINEKNFTRYEKEKFKYVLRLNIGNIELGIDALLLTRILRTLKANDVGKIVFHVRNSLMPIKITTDKKHYGLIMPFFIPEKIEDLVEGIYVSQQIYYPISDKDFRSMSKKYGEYLTEFSKMVGGERMAEGGEITMNVPLLLRVLELAKEDVKEDKELHFIAERLQSLSKKGTLTMEDYDYISGLESNDKIQKLIAENDSNDSDLRFEQGGEIEDLISSGIVDLKMFDTTPKHAKEYGFQCLNPLFIQTICVSEPKRLKDIGKKVLSYIEKYAIENGHDLIFGHITEKFCDIDMIKNWLKSNGYSINNENNDFHKVIRSNKLEGGGSVLLAPNGKPSNLTPEQWHLVRTPEFKAWFGDWEALENAKLRDKGMDEITLNQLAKNVSKVVDENGEPLVCFHGTRTRGEQGIFSIFDIERGGESNTLAKVGFWFTPKQTFAKNFADNSWWGKEKTFVYAVFIKIKNPKVYTTDDSNYGDAYEKFRTSVYAIDGQSQERANMGGIGYALKNPKETLNKFRESLYLNGFDGIFIKNTRFDRGIAGGNNDQYVVLFSEQIKLANGTNTTFDGNNPDIRFESGGKIEMPEKDEINPEQIRAEIEALEEVLEVLQGEDRKPIQDEIEALKFALGELEHTKLLAPNGKPSNLTPEQWHLVRTPQFKAWFGDWENSPNTASKVVDENGEPLVVFREIEATEKNYFNTEVPNFAKSVRWQTNLDRILRRKLPSETKVGDEVIGFNKRGVVTEINNGLFKIKYEDGSVFSGNAFGLTFYGEKKPKKVLSAFLNIRILGDYEKLFVHSFGVQKDSGILSISPDFKTYFTFRSNQVKLADGSNTTFDANNPDIRFVEGGQIENERSIFGNSTGIKKYDILLKQGKAKIYEIQPDDFINHIPSLEDIEKNPKLKRRWVRPNINPKTDIQVQNLINKIKLGIELDMPIIDEDFYDGMHRSFALKELGIKKMPVVITNDYWKNSTFKKQKN